MSEKELSFHLSLSRFQFSLSPSIFKTIRTCERFIHIYKKTQSVAAIGFTATDRVIDVV